MNIKDLDLNLLRVFDAVYRVRKVGRAAELLDLTQPAVSQGLTRLRLLLKDGLPRKEKVAEKFHMTVRTLQRHLQQAGTSYQEILDQLRQELAEHYLLRSDLAIQDIACYLGFTESRSFHRSFKSWTGQTPGEFRESRRRDNPLG